MKFQPCIYCQKTPGLPMMTSPNENIFRVTSHLGTGEFPARRPVTRSFDVFFDLRLNKRLSKQSQGYHAHYDVIVMRVW